jgi:6-phosphogluconolactonase
VKRFIGRVEIKFQEEGMSNFAKVVIAAVSAAMCICWTGCGGGPQHPCQGATCVPSAGKFLYVTASDDVSGFRVGANGTPTGSQNQSGPNQSIGVAADPSGKFLYVSDFENATIVAFSINQSSGLLTAIGAPVSAGSPPDAGGLAMDPAGKFLYVTLMNSSAVAGFSIDPVTGALSAIPGASVPAGNTPVQAIVDSSGKFLYVSNLNDSLGGISGYSIDATTGDLTPIPGSPFPTQAGFPGPAAFAIGGGGKFLYVGMVGTANANNTISGFSIDPTTGVLSQLVGSPFPAGQGPIRVAADSAGKFLFSANLFDDTVSAFTIDATSGALGQVAGSPYPTNSAPVAVVVDPDGKYVYVANTGSGDLSVFSLNSTSGALSALAGSPFSTGQQEPGGLAFVKTH